MTVCYVTTVCWNCYYNINGNCAIHKCINIHDKKYCEDYVRRMQILNKSGDVE